MYMKKIMQSVSSIFFLTVLFSTTCLANPTAVLQKASFSSRSSSSWSSHYDTSWYEPTASSYVINDAADLAAFAVAVNSGQTFAGKTVTLNGDIDLSPYSWEPIGRAKYKKPSSEDTVYSLSSSASRFQGTFDGNGKTISHMNLYNTSTDDDYGQGLFAVNAGTIKNLTLTDSLITGTYGINGGIAGIVDAGGKILDCQVTDTVTIKAITEDANGGIAGFILPESEINQCVNKAEITDSSISGGIVGAALPALNDSTNPSIIINCNNDGLVSGHIAGGIIGVNHGTQIDQCTNSGTVEGSSYAGALVGLQKAKD